MTAGRQVQRAGSLEELLVSLMGGAKGGELSGL
jgi:hypothetical protein